MNPERIEQEINEATSNLALLRLALKIALGFWRDWRAINGVAD